MYNNVYRSFMVLDLLYLEEATQYGASSSEKLTSWQLHSFVLDGAEKTPVAKSMCLTLNFAG